MESEANMAVPLLYNPDCYLLRKRYVEVCRLGPRNGGTVFAYLKRRDLFVTPSWLRQGKPESGDTTEAARD